MRIEGYGPLERTTFAVVRTAPSAYSLGGVSLWVDGGLLCPGCETARPPREYGAKHRKRKYAAVLDVIRVCPACRYEFATPEPDPATSEGM